jgi:Flp pilus assembly protein TadB
MAIGAVVLLIGTALTRRRGPATPLTRGTAVRLVLVGAGLAVYQVAYFAAVAQAGVSIATLVALGLAPLLISRARRRRRAVPAEDGRFELPRVLSQPAFQASAIGH